MHRYRMILVFLLITGAAFCAAAQEGARKVTTKTANAEQEVRSVINAWAQAVKNRDMESLDRIYADDIFITVDGGSTRGKKEEMEILKPSATMRTISVTNESLRVRVFPRSNTAVVTAIVRMVFRTNGRDSPFAMRYTSFWEKRSGRWQLTVLQTTRLNK